MRIIRDNANGILKLSQSKYVKIVLNRFNMNKAKPVSTPLGSHFKLSKEQSPKTEEEVDYMSKISYASTIGSLMYAMVCTRPNIAHAVGVVSRFMSRPRKQHWETVKWILRYLKGSLDTCLCFTCASLKLQGYVDADFLLVILIVERVLLDLFLLQVVQLYHGLQFYKRLLICLLQKLSILQQLKLERK